MQGHVWANLRPDSGSSIAETKAWPVNVGSWDSVVQQITSEPLARLFVALGKATGFRQQPEEEANEQSGPPTTSKACWAQNRAHSNHLKCRAGTDDLVLEAMPKSSELAEMK